MEKKGKSHTQAFVFDVGVTGFYGQGFGLPLVLGLPDEQLGCGSSDFRSLVDAYGLGFGPGAFLPASDGATAANLASRFKLVRF